jgi:hypothetical protein
VSEFFSCKHSNDDVASRGMKKLELLSLVKAQIEHWPLRGKQKKLRQDKVTKDRLLKVLLNPRHGFSTTTPRKTRTGTTQTEPQRMLSGNHDSISVSIGCLLPRLPRFSDPFACRTLQ